ncbi:hypothetical protein F8S09_13190 [Deinococcus sp. SDU3-2]|uniref:Glycosyl hydrolase family 98 putative carbohydrate-binding module domain-containing protein n=1 Tax=Deinococcus terrestris TaxID=2651870 RepID=A0A7X1NXH7_9DEIO|nr:NPCBM/NEW2 domain-containing protein [Deinococcus terrestris]MPY67627.1 hypothetical protein [Deinococcus terrestris]
MHQPISPSRPLRPLSLGVLALSALLSACGRGTPSPTQAADLEESPTLAALQATSTTTLNLADLPWAASTNSRGPVERNQSYGGDRPGDGRTMTMGGTTYATGLGVHADSSLTFNLPAQCGRFMTSIGIDDEVGAAGSVVFEVYADGRLLYRSGRLTGSMAPKNINLNVVGVRELRLMAHKSDNDVSDHANWANPVLTQCAGVVPPATPPAPVPAPAPTLSAPVNAPAGFVNVKAYGAKCDGVADDSAAIQRALTNEAKVYIPAGTCVVGNLELKSNQTVMGEGSASVLLQKVGAQYALSANPGRKGTPNVADNLRHIQLERFKLKGQAGRVAFDEHIHLLNLNAVSDVTVNEMVFEGYVGDGVYLGSSNTRNTERHNERVKILNSQFDGVVKNNRNGISIIDGTDIEIRGSTFVRTGRRGMPGAIDLEPDGDNDAFSRIRNITIDDCEFRDVGADTLIALLLRPQDNLTTPSQNITISNVRGYGNNQEGQTGLGLTHSSWSSTRLPTATTPPLNLKVINSTFDGIYRPFLFTQMKGAVIENTTFKNARAFAYIGTGDGAGFNRDITLNNVTFDNVGYDPNLGYKALTIYSNDGVTLNKVTVKNGNGLGIAFSSGESRNIRILESRIINDNGKLVYGIKRFNDHVLNRATNVASNIELLGVKGNDFLQ